MKSSFMDYVRNTLIQEHPGKTARWYAKQYLELGHYLNDSKIPVESLTNALERHIGLGREQSIRREKIDGVFHYYPVNSDLEAVIGSRDETMICQVELSGEDIRDINNLLAVDKFINMDKAVSWLVKEGIKANRDYLEKVDEVVQKTVEVNKILLEPDVLQGTVEY